MRSLDPIPTSTAGRLFLRTAALWSLWTSNTESSKSRPSPSAESCGPATKRTSRFPSQTCSFSRPSQRPTSIWSWPLQRRAPSWFSQTLRREERQPSRTSRILFWPAAGLGEMPTGWWSPAGCLDDTWSRRRPSPCSFWMANRAALTVRCQMSREGTQWSGWARYERRTAGRFCRGLRRAEWAKAWENL